MKDNYTDKKSKDTVEDEIQEVKDEPNDIQKEKIRAMVNNIYSIQKMRIQCGNRLVASFMGFGEKSRNRTQESVKAEQDKKEQDENDKAVK